MVAGRPRKVVALLGAIAHAEREIRLLFFTDVLGCRDHYAPASSRLADPAAYRVDADLTWHELQGYLWRTVQDVDALEAFEGRYTVVGDACNEAQQQCFSASDAEDDRSRYLLLP